MDPRIEFVRTCCDLERRLGTLYRRLAAVLPDAETARLFGTLADEEDTHAQSLELVQRLLARTRNRPPVSPELPKDAGRLRQGLGTALALLDAGKNIEVGEALRMAIRIEASGFETVGVGALGEGDAEVARTLRMLQVADRTHRERLATQLAAWEAAPTAQG